MKKGLPILIFGILFLLFLNAFVSADYDWKSFGSDTFISQTTGLKGHFNQGYYAYSSTTLFGTTFQPLIANLTNIGQTYIILTDGNYIELLNNQLIPEKEFFVGGTQISEMAITDFDGDGKSNEIVGIWNISGQIKFLAISFNYSINNLTIIKQVNLSSIASAVKCKSGQYCYFYEKASNYTNFTFINMTTTENDIKSCQIFNKAIISSYDANVPKWATINGIDYYLFLGKSGAFSTINAIDDDCNFLFTKNWTDGVPSSHYYYPTSASFFAGTTCSFWGLFCSAETKIVYSYLDVGATWTYSYVKLARLDGSDYWSENICTSGGSYSCDTSLNVFAGDYNNDALPDVWVSVADTYLGGGVQQAHLKILNGNNKNLLKTATLSGSKVRTMLFSDLNNDGTNDIVLDGTVIDPNTNATIFIDLATTNFTYCIPVDIILDGSNDLVCSRTGNTTIFTANYTNQNAHITSVVLDPSSTIAINSTLVAYIYANDPESDTIYYSHKCSATDTASNWTTSNAKTCVYSQAGNYLLSVYARDIFHSDYSTLTINITVTPTGLPPVCNNNGICDTDLGETNANCPYDCPVAPNQTTGTGAEIGLTTTTLPTDIVNPTNINQGLLPEIYFGILAFFSNVAHPLIILVFVIFIAGIIILMGKLVSKFAHGRA